MVKTSVVRGKSYTESDAFIECYYQAAGGKSLVVIFPGTNYSCDRPVLHFARKIGIVKGHDVLCFSYGSDLPWEEKGLDIVEFEITKCMTIIKDALKATHKKIYFISKSVGSIIAGRISEELGYENVKNIFLTPMNETIPFILVSKCSVILGSEDGKLSKENLEIIRQYRDIELVLIEGANHSLEMNTDIEGSLKILEQVAKELMNMIEE